MKREGYDRIENIPHNCALTTYPHRIWKSRDYLLIMDANSGEKKVSEDTDKVFLKQGNWCETFTYLLPSHLRLQ